MNNKDPNYRHFKEEFWDWFDNLPKAKKRTFWNYKFDMAEANFFFTVWEKKHDTNQVCKR